MNIEPTANHSDPPKEVTHPPESLTLSLGRICDELQDACRNNQRLPGNVLEQLERLTQWFVDTRKLRTPGYQLLPAEKWQILDGLSLLSRCHETVIEVAALVGLQGCERLLDTGMTQKAAWLELKKLLPKTDGPPTANNCSEIDSDLLEKVRNAIGNLGRGVKRDAIRKHVKKRKEDVNRVLDFLEKTGEYEGPRS